MMTIAFAIAERSTCLRRKVGAVATNRIGRILAVAHNGSPKGYPHCIDQPCPGACAASGTGLDLCEAIHAEMNLLSFCPDIMRIATIYVTASPCITCIKSIANSSCTRIVFSEPYPHEQVEAFWLRGRSHTWERRSWQHHADINRRYADPS